MAMEVVMMNPPKRRFKFGASKRRKSYRKRSVRKVSITGLLKGRRRKGLRKSSSKLWSALRRGRAKMRRNVGPWQELGSEYSIITPAAPSKMSARLAKYSSGGLAAVLGKKFSGTSPKHPKKFGKKATKRKTAKRTTRKYHKKATRKGTTKMAKRRGWKGGKRAHKIAWALGRASRKRGKSRWSFLRKYKIGKKRIAGYRRRHRMSRSRRLSGRAFSFMYKGKRIAANRRRSHRRYAKNRGLTTWQKLVKAHGVKGAKRMYRGNRKSGRRRYRRNRETYQIGPVAANRSRRRHRSYRRNRELYQVSPAFSANPTTAALAFPKAVFSVPFLMKNVVPLAAGAIGSKLIGGLLTKYVLKGSQWTDAPWKKAAFVAGSGVLGGLAIGMATKGRKADWAYKFAAGGMAAALITLFDAYMASTFKTWGLNGIGDYSGIGYGSDDLKRRIAEELKTELDGVGGFITQEDMDRGISSSGGSVSGFVTAEDLPSEGSSISMDDFATTAAM